MVSYGECIRTSALRTNARRCCGHERTRDRDRWLDLSACSTKSSTQRLGGAVPNSKCQSRSCSANAATTGAPCVDSRGRNAPAPADSKPRQFAPGQQSINSGRVHAKMLGYVAHCQYVHIGSTSSRSRQVPRPGAEGVPRTRPRPRGPKRTGARSFCRFPPCTFSLRAMHVVLPRYHDKGKPVYDCALTC